MKRNVKREMLISTVVEIADAVMTITDRVTIFMRGRGDGSMGATIEIQKTRDDRYHVSVGGNCFPDNMYFVKDPIETLHAFLTNQVEYGMNKDRSGNKYYFGYPKVYQYDLLNKVFDFISIYTQGYKVIKYIDDNVIETSGGWQYPRHKN